MNPIDLRTLQNVETWNGSIICFQVFFENIVFIKYPKIKKIKSEFGAGGGIQSIFKWDKMFLT